MEQLIVLIKQFKCYFEERFKMRYVVEKFGVLSSADIIETKDNFGYQLTNNGNITAIVNGTILVRPDSSFANGNWEGYKFSSNIQVTFDDANIYGFNTVGTSKRIEYIVKKLE